MGSPALISNSALAACCPIWSIFWRFLWCSKARLTQLRELFLVQKIMTRQLCLPLYIRPCTEWMMCSYGHMSSWVLFWCVVWSPVSSSSTESALVPCRSSCHLRRWLCRLAVGQ